jgi:WhiB family redox-sensing transcriptional regulator
VSVDAFLDAIQDPWRLDAKCREMHPDDFFIQPGALMSTAVEAACRACPVSEECLDYALEHNIKHGIWGGLTPRKRRGLRAARRS